MPHHSTTSRRIVVPAHQSNMTPSSHNNTSK
ncbi:TPA: hypothetical protein I1E43_001867 [Staphylococcus aureus]|nr:hypothetical protein [Staphylococcus aureus]HAR3808993.1 hypothetical protein [Staphylococcus aureus]